VEEEVIEVVTAGDPHHQGGDRVLDPEIGDVEVAVVLRNVDGVADPRIVADPRVVQQTERETDLAVAQENEIVSLAVDLEIKVAQGVEKTVLPEINPDLVQSQGPNQNPHTNLNLPALQSLPEDLGLVQNHEVDLEALVQQRRQKTNREMEMRRKELQMLKLVAIRTEKMIGQAAKVRIKYSSRKVDLCNYQF